MRLARESINAVVLNGAVPKPRTHQRRYEARCQERFKSLIEASPDTAAQFSVPGTVPDLCAPRVLTTEWVEGVAIDKARAAAALIILKLDNPKP